MCHKVCNSGGCHKVQAPSQDISMPIAQAQRRDRPGFNQDDVMEGLRADARKKVAKQPPPQQAISERVKNMVSAIVDNIKKLKPTEPDVAPVASAPSAPSNNRPVSVV